MTRLGLFVRCYAILAVVAGFACFADFAVAQTPSATYDPGKLDPVETQTKLKVGDPAPDFTLHAVSGRQIRLSDFKGKKNVVLSFVPAAFTPVCSQQWPGYNIARTFFEKNNATLLGISVDNVPSLYAWTHQMGDLWFDVLSDFWPHGAVSQSYGILRPEGVAERAVFILDKDGMIQYMDIHDINSMPRLEDLVKELEKLNK